MTREEKLALVKSRRWYHSIEIEPDLVTPGMRLPAELQQLLTYVELPSRLDGLTVLDIGAWDGFFSFEAERRGAKRVVAYDLVPADHCGFDTARTLLGSGVEYVQGSVYDLGQENVGRFDIVLFFGVLYHLRYPLLALDRIHDVCGGRLLLETHCLDNCVILGEAESTTLERIDRRLASIPLYRFYAANELNRDYSNWFSPNQRAIEDGLRTAGFEPTLLAQWGDRVAYRALKREGPQPYLHATYEGTATKSLTRTPLIQAPEIARDRMPPVAVEPSAPSVRAGRSALPDRIVRTAVSSCWCGGDLGEPVAPRYRRCVACGSAVLAARPAAEHFRVVDDEHDFYGRTYWTEYAEARSFPDICARARSDLSERCVFWIARLLEAVHPPGRVLEIGCGHGGFVKLMRELGFDALGTELSPWVVDFARRTFDVPVLLGRLETLPLEPGFRCIAAFDVLEHLDDPLDTMRRCRELLAGDGTLLLQTPCYRGEGPEWSMFQPDEHIHLFTEAAVEMLLRRAGFEAVTVQPSLFPHDMWVVARPDASATPPTGEARIPAAFQALLGLQVQVAELGRTLALVEADRADRLTQVHELTDRLQELTEQLAASEADRAARLDQIHTLTRRLTTSDADRAERLAQVNQLTRKIHEVSDELTTANADRAARLTQIHELTRHVRDLTGRLATSEADRQARLDAIEALQAELTTVRAELDTIRSSWVWKATRPLRPGRGQRSPR